MSTHAAQQIVGLIMGTILPLIVLTIVALLTRPWNIRKKSS